MYSGHTKRTEDIRTILDNCEHGNSFVYNLFAQLESKLFASANADHHRALEIATEGVFCGDSCRRCRVYFLFSLLPPLFMGAMMVFLSPQSRLSRAPLTSRRRRRVGRPPLGWWKTAGGTAAGGSEAAGARQPQHGSADPPEQSLFSALSNSVNNHHHGCCRSCQEVWPEDQRRRGFHPRWYFGRRVEDHRRPDRARQAAPPGTTATRRDATGRPEGRDMTRTDTADTTPTREKGRSACG